VTSDFERRQQELAIDDDLRPYEGQWVQTPLLGRMDFMSGWGVTIDEPARRLGLERLV
jgi:hypothetical protein